VAKETTEEMTVRAECARCGGTRNCKVQGRFRDNGEDADGYFQWWEDWRILQCLGCDYVFVQKVSSNSESYSHDENGDIELDEVASYWPALAKRKRPEWMSDAGIDASGVEKLDEALVELYGALNNDLFILAAVGIRTSFDVASEILGVDPSVSFKTKLDGLVDKGHIGKADRSRIEVLVDAGSASAHRGWKPTPQDLVIMTEILEHFVHDAFIAPSRKARLDAKAAKMKATVPPRQKNSLSGIRRLDVFPTEIGVGRLRNLTSKYGLEPVSVEEPIIIG
jgi:hypothetical protein